MKRALLVNVIDPKIGGVLIRGEKGTAKSTAVRALAGLLPERDAHDCACGCDPTEAHALCPDCRESPERRVVRNTARVVELPLGATEDRLVGSLDLEAAIRDGRRSFQPGVLAAAHRNILYVDEVNLLDDHLIDVLLDAAAMGFNTVEREGVSYAHPARFTLVGTMNPEEGELRPQLLDRFGLCVEIAGIREVEARLTVIDRLGAFDADPAGFVAQWAETEAALSRRLAEAREALAAIAVSRTALEGVAKVAIELEVDGHRADLVMVKTARALSALDGKDAVDGPALLEAALLALPHRMRRKPFQEVGVDSRRIAELLCPA